MQKRPNAATFKGKGITLAGPQLKAGDKAPDFACLSGLDTVTLQVGPSLKDVYGNVMDAPFTGTFTVVS
jgi:peroxiredoxin